MKIVLIGAAGGIGSSAAYSLALNGIGDELVLVDTNDDALKTHIWDLEQLRVNVRPFAVRSGSIHDAVDADVVVFTAAVPPRKDSPRIEFLGENLKIVRETAALLAGVDDWQGVLVLATNPVDPLVTEMQRITGIDRHRILGYNINDSSRLRYGIAEALSIEPHRVSAWVLGEHGNECVPLFHNVKIDGEPIELTEVQQQAATQYLLDWYPRWVQLGVLRTSTWTSGHGLASMVKDIVTDSRAEWPSSLVLDGEYGVTGTALGVPVRLSCKGAEILEWELSAELQQKMQEAAGFVEAALDQVGARATN